MSDIDIRMLTPAEVDTAVSWARDEGWNPGLSDAAIFRRVDPEGFLGCLVDGELVSVISAIRYGDDVGFVGFYIAAPHRRGQGYGMQVGRAALAHLEGVRSIGIDGVVEQQDNYRRSGFVLAHRNARYAGEAPLPFAAAGEADAGVSLVPAADVPRDDLVAYDAAHFGTARPGFLDDWISTPGHHALAAVAPDGIRGLGVARPCVEGVKIGPLFAQDAVVAERLLGELSRGVPAGTTVYVDPPLANAAAVALVERLGMQPVFETGRMYLGEPFAHPLDEIFGITTFELG